MLPKDALVEILISAIPTKIFDAKEVQHYSVTDSIEISSNLWNFEFQQLWINDLFENLTWHIGADNIETISKSDLCEILLIVVNHSKVLDLECKLMNLFSRLN